MSFFHRKKATPPVVSAVDVVSTIDTMTHVRGVGGHQELLAGPPRRVKVELMPWERSDTITAKIGGERVGEIDCSPALHHILLAMRKNGLPSLIVDGEVRRGDVVPRYLAVALPNPDELKTLAPKGWVPAESPINVHMTTHYQDALHALYGAKTRRREAQVTFRDHEGGKYAGRPEGVITLDGQIIGELSAGADAKWSIILEDRKAGIPGRLMVLIQPGHGGHAEGESPYYVEAVYRRQASTD